MDGKEIQINGKDYQCDKLMCAIECSKAHECYSFSHDVKTNRCVLYDDVITTGVYDASSKWRYYTSPDRPKIPVLCPTDYHEESDMCFIIYPEFGLGLEYSRLYCQQNDADLVIIDSERKQQTINSYLTQGTSYLIGLYSSRYSSVFEWVDDLTYVNYTNWAPNEPSNMQSADQRCAIIEYYSFHGQFKWGSYECNTVDAIICEVTGFAPSVTNA
ncbi:hypothetical protein LOTGIDRAFT_169749 [Lottia gigantea]|uniref:C-type lectin domain-containing protein n=1 Tax=Lottia gigantea TaxID=225164 RepID=V3ZQE7_LOTGI|nr:hypothetical protein LOTGIDRAFT_169749 [Lottia gigantea]ESO83106.1 hypothetical protein LOTGIDRAFT_169749 [Lottia gigantea]